MCMPCCCVTYEKYLTKDYELIDEKVYALIGEMVVKGWDDDQITKWLNDICRCDCHIEGLKVLH